METSPASPSEFDPSDHPGSAAGAPAGKPDEPSNADHCAQRNGRARPWWGEHEWAPYVLPMAAFMLVGAFEPAAPSAIVLSVDPGLLQRYLGIDYQAWPIVYAAKIALVIVAMAVAWPMYRSWPWKLTRWAAPCGLVGAVVWIGLCKLRVEPALYQLVGLDGWADSQRSGYNPLVELAGRPALAQALLALRAVGLVLLVPIVEEFFLRGFLARWVTHATWRQVPFGELSGPALTVLTLYPVLTHPSEALAAVVWFSGVSWLMFRTRNIWDCVVAHAITNLGIGAWAVATGDWSML